MTGGQYNVMGVKHWPEQRQFTDERGLFRDLPKWEEASSSYTKRAGTLRGLHGDNAMCKFVTVLHGMVFDVVADARLGSPTYGKHDVFILSASYPTVLFVPDGCVHGFLTLTDDVVFYYAKTNKYDAEREFSVRYDDPTLGIRWPVWDDELIISEKDRLAPFLH
jgi:dTDP-4-dehydrorhamnose 3,5-epimerase